MCYKLFIFILIISFSVCAKSETPPTQQQIALSRKMHEDIIKRSKAGRFKIEGIVIDENGNPLNDVRLRITKAISRGFLGSKTSSRNEIIKAKFSLNESGCNALFLEFYKKGYFVVNRSYTIKMKAEKNIYP